MSRVFEALNKAKNDKKHHDELATEKVEPALSTTALFGNGAETEGSRAGQNGEQHDDATTPKVEPVLSLTASLENRPEKSDSLIALPVSKNGHKSWREKLEELVFGWDLRRYTGCPIFALDKNSPAAEQYKILREQVKRLRNEAGVQSIAISSPVKKDGKTTVAANLAAALALDYEENVLLIDADLRNPGIHRYFDLRESPGLAEFLSSNTYTRVKNLVQPTFLPSLLVLPAGRPSHFSSELLAKEKMNQAMQEIRREFPGYLIVIDCPPVLPTPDPLVIARHVDGVLMVMRAGKTPRDYLTKALQSINSNKVMGVILNGADMGIASKYYYYTPTEIH